MKAIIQLGTKELAVYASTMAQRKRDDVIKEKAKIVKYAQELSCLMIFVETFFRNKSLIDPSKLTLSSKTNQVNEYQCDAREQTRLRLTSCPERTIAMIKP